MPGHLRLLDGTGAVHVQRLLGSSVRTSSRSPLTGILAVQTADGSVEFEIDEETAHAIRADIEHFLSQ
jgi:hypothetical protein